MKTRPLCFFAQKAADLMKNNPQRLYYIDWLRVLAMLSIFFFHADRFFDYYDWHVKNGELNIISSIHISFFSQWMMPLFFFLSGAAVFYSLKLRSSYTFLWDRVKRILIPLTIVGYFITSPPQMYFERLTHNRFEGSFWDFIPAYFQGVDMFGGNFPWHGFHLWYLVYLFIFSVILLPLFKPRKNQKPSILSSLSNWFEGPWRLMLLVIPLIIVNIFIDYNDLGFMRGTGGWDLFSYLFILVYGYLFFCNEKILETIKRIQSISLILAIILSLAGLVVGFGIKPEISENTPILYLVVTFIRCFRVLLWIIAIIGLGGKYLNFNNRFLGYANEAVLPFYILHQFVLLLIGYWVVQWQINALVKYIVIATLSFIAIMGLYDIIIKRFQVTRFLFGLKLKGKDDQNR
jgi:peptidoglycan/LPS O-acetylase OafA/YrhL